MIATQIRVLLLSGSLSNPSHTRANLELLARLLRERGAGTYLWDLYSDPLPVPNLMYYRNPHAHESTAVRLLARLADYADAFVWATPVYHNSFSGVLKNTLDNLDIHQFHQKPVALISHGGDRGGVRPSDQLRLVAQSLSAMVIPTQITTTEADFEVRQNRYVLVNPQIAKRFVHMTDELITYSLFMSQLRKSFL
jgi:azobenzene reductase